MTLFDKWYSHYPRKKDKGHARKAFERINPSEEMVEGMINAIDLQIKEMEVRRQRGLQVPDWKYPATWLNGECWLDEVDLQPDFIDESVKKLNNPAKIGESTKEYEQRLMRIRH